MKLSPIVVSGICLLAGCGMEQTAASTQPPSTTSPMATTTTMIATTTTTSAPVSVLVVEGDELESEPAPVVEPPTSVTGPTKTADAELAVGLRFESRVGDEDNASFRAAALASLNDPRGWQQAGFTFRSDNASTLEVILADPAETDALCQPLSTAGYFSCQVGRRVMINADRWRSAIETWDGSLSDYRDYVINHEVGHLIGRGHPVSRCPEPAQPAPVMAQQTKGLQGCTGNGWPSESELEAAKRRPTSIGY